MYQTLNSDQCSCYKMKFNDPDDPCASHFHPIDSVDPAWASPRIVWESGGIHCDFGHPEVLPLLVAGQGLQRSVGCPMVIFDFFRWMTKCNVWCGNRCTFASSFRHFSLRSNPFEKEDQMTPVLDRPLYWGIGNLNLG